MFRIPAFFCLFVFASITVLSQRTISGKVINAVTKEPIPGSSVFISNTSFGTISGRDGSFELADISPGKYDLIISSVGYETSVYSFTTDKLPLRLSVELQQKIKELANVTIEPSVEEGWDKWGKVFMDNFIGQSADARQCKIKNEKSIRFRFYRKSNRLVAYSDDQIIVENKALGYIIKYQLEDFEINYKASTTMFVGYPLIEEIDKKRKGLQRRWQRNRDKAYYGSMMHFMRAVYSNSLAAEGYEVRRMVRTPNLEKERIRKMGPSVLTRIQGGSNMFRSGTTPRTKGVTISVNNKGVNAMPALPNSDSTFSKDSAEYYRRVLGQEDHVDTYGRELLTADSLIVERDGEFKILFFQNYVYVTYKNELEEEEYLQYYNEQRSPTFQRSYIWLQNGQPISIDANGSYYPPQEIFSMSYWGWNEKISSLLPLDYKPYSVPESKVQVK